MLKNACCSEKASWSIFYKLVTEIQLKLHHVTNTIISPLIWLKKNVQLSYLSIWEHNILVHRFLIKHEKWKDGIFWKSFDDYILCFSTPSTCTSHKYVCKKKTILRFDTVIKVLYISGSWVHIWNCWHSCDRSGIRCTSPWNQIHWDAQWTGSM